MRWRSSPKPCSGTHLALGSPTLRPRSRGASVRRRLIDATLDFSIAASALRHSGDDIAFTHQLIQEYLASRVLLEASRDHGRTASEFWPDKRWWARTGWEVVAEIAAESCEGDLVGQTALIAWLAQSNPEVACDVWQHTGRPALPETLSRQTSDHWLPRMTDTRAEPDPRARASIGRALGRFGLDIRKGVGLRSDGIPDIDWVTIPGDQPFIYQYGERLTLPRFRIARYPITNRQYQAFINAGGYTQARWWHGLAQRIEAPAEPQWSEPNSPRERVSWLEAMAFCAWITDRLGDEITLPTEHQWERAARGLDGREYPWGEDYRAGHANCDETRGREIKRHAAYIGQTTAVGIYPQAKSPEGVLDLAGNVWEWCLNEIDSPERTQGSGNAARALRGGSWINDPGRCRAANRDGAHPDHRGHDVGFRVCCGSPIE